MRYMFTHRGRLSRTVSGQWGLIDVSYSAASALLAGDAAEIAKHGERLHFWDIFDVSNRAM